MEGKKKKKLNIKDAFYTRRTSQGFTSYKFDEDGRMIKIKKISKKKIIPNNMRDTILKNATYKQEDKFTKSLKLPKTKK